MRDFAKRCSGILKEAVSFFEKEACSYAKVVVEKVRKEIVELLMAELYQSFDAQLKMTKSTLINDFEDNMTKICHRGDRLNQAFYE